MVRTEGSLPAVVDLGDGPLPVVSLAEHWVVEVGWWRTPPARWERRSYWRILLEDGRCVDVYWDGGRRLWRLARLWG